MFDQRYYQYIQAIADCRGFSKAAEKLYISQSFLSHFVKNVEEDFGITLFDRKSSPIRLTDAGIKYLEYMKKFYRLEHDMRSDLSSMSTHAPMCLSISSLRFLGAYVLPKILPGFVALNPSVNLQISEGSVQDITRLLEVGKTDLFITNLPLESDAFHAHKICDDPIMIVAPYNEKMQRLFPDQKSSPSNPLQSDFGFLKEEPLIILKNGLNMRVAAEAVCRHYNFQPGKVLEAPSLPSALGLVGGNKGITFVCRSSVENLRPEIPLIYFSTGEMENFTSILAVYRKENKNPMIGEFLSCASSQLSMLQTPYRSD